MKVRIVCNKKGITPIISVILLLMMTIAIAGLAYTWLTKMQASLENSTEAQQQRFLKNVEVDLKTDAYYLLCAGSGAASMNVTVRNAGTRAANNLRIYLNDVFYTGGNITSLSAGNVQTLNVTIGNCATFNGTTTRFKITSTEAETTDYISTACTSSSANCV